MGKKSYDSYSDMHRGGGKGGPGMQTKPKGKMPMATDTKVMGADPNRKWSSAGANVTESRLNKGGDQAWKGKRKGVSRRSTMPY